MSTETTQKSHLYYVIPGEIFDDLSLSADEKLLFALLSGLSHKDGTCYPSNEYLEGRMNIRKVQLQIWLKNLEKHGYISRDTKPCSANPFRKIRTITVHTNFKKVLRGTENRTPGETENRTPGETENRTIVSEEINIESEEIYPPIIPPPPPDLFTQGDVVMTKGEYRALIDKFGASDVSFTIHQLDLYAKIDPQKFKKYKSHAAVVQAWILKERKKEEKWKKNKTWKTGAHLSGLSGTSKPISSDTDMQEPVFATPEEVRRIYEESLRGSKN